MAQTGGRLAMDEMGILPEFEGRPSTYRLQSYQEAMDCEHFLRNAHHLRELQYVLTSTMTSWCGLFPPELCCL